MMIKFFFTKLSYIKFIHDSQFFYSIYTVLFKIFINSRIPTKIQNHYMYLDSSDRAVIFFRGVHEPLSTELINKIIQKGDIAIDIGAAIGYYTLIFADLAGTLGKVYAFEPDVAMIQILERNIRLNNCNNVILIPKGAYNYSGRAKILGNEESEVITINEYFKNQDNAINFLKIDIEGFELEAIEGMDAILRNSKRLSSIIEFLPETPKNKKSDILSKLSFYGLVPLLILNEGGQQTQKVHSSNDIFNLKYPVNIFFSNDEQVIKTFGA
jgi:predicted RNA methylase